MATWHHWLLRGGFPMVRRDEREGATIKRTSWVDPCSPRSRNDGLAVAALVVATLLIAWYNYSANLFISRIDALTQYVPWYSYLGERLRAGELPGWMPFSMSGVPFAGDPQSGWGYMPAMVLSTIVPGEAGFKALILFHLLLAALATYAFARVIGLSVVGGMVAASVFTFPGMIERVRCCTIHVEVAVWVPVAFLGIELGSREREWKGRAVWWGLAGVAASQMAAGWVGQGAVYGLMTVGAYALYRVALAPPDGTRDWRARVERLVLAGVVIGGVTAVLAATALLPRFEVVDRSNLSGGSYDAVGASSTGGWRIDQLIDRLLTMDDGSGRWYAGGVAIALAVLAPLMVRRRYQMAFFVPFGLVVLILILRETIVHKALYLIPAFEQFHGHRPDRVLTVFPIVPAILAGAVVTVAPEWRWRSRYAPMFGVVPMALLFLVWYWRPDNDVPIAPETIWPVAAACLALVLALTLADRRVQTAMLLLCVLAVIWDPFGRQLVLGEHDFTNKRDALERAYVSDTKAGAFLQERRDAGEMFRFFGYDPAMLTHKGKTRTYHVSYSNAKTVALLAINRGIPLELEDTQGYNPVQIQRYVDFLVKLNGQEQSYHAANVLFHGATSPLIDLLNVRYIVLPRDVPPGRPDLFHLSQRYPTVYVDEQVRVVEKTDSLPRAWVVHSARTGTDQEALDLLASSTVDPRLEAILPPDVALPMLEWPVDPAGERVTIVDRSPDAITLQAELGAPGLVVLSEIWDPDWTVEIDGKRADLLRANSLLRAVAVPAGTHTITLRYESTTLLASAAISGAGWLAVLLGGIAVALSRLGVVRTGRARHDEKLGLDPADGAETGRARDKPRPLVDPPSALVEGRDR